VRGAELAISSNSDKTMWVVIAMMLMIFFGGLLFSATFREALVEGALITTSVFIGFAVFVLGTVSIMWFRNSPPGNNFALATRAAVGILLISICYVYPLIPFICTLLAGLGWLAMNDPSFLR
jgi:FtsH-binding integral membrane protein